MTDILFSSAAEVALLLRRREISSRELTELLLARIAAVNPAVNAVVEVDADMARRAADAADDAVLRSDELGPLHGIPMTIKDSFDVAGMRTTWGNPAFKDFVADADATVVTRLRRAGPSSSARPTCISCWPTTARPRTNCSEPPTIPGI